MIRKRGDEKKLSVATCFWKTGDGKLEERLTQIFYQKHTFFSLWYTELYLDTKAYFN